MKKLTLFMGLLLLFGSTGLASAEEWNGRSAVGLRIGARFPGFQFVYGRPRVYCWYQGRYFDRAGWERFERFHRDRYSFDRREYGRQDHRPYGFQDHDRGYRDEGARQDPARSYDRD